MLLCSPLRYLVIPFYQCCCWYCVAVAVVQHDFIDTTPHTHTRRTSVAIQCQNHLHPLPLSISSVSLVWLLGLFTAHELTCNKLTHRRDEFIGHDLIGCSETRTVGARSFCVLRTLPVFRTVAQFSLCAVNRPLCGHFIDQAVIWHWRVLLEGSCPHALADGSWSIQIKVKTLEFSSEVLPVPSPYCQFLLLVLLPVHYLSCQVAYPRHCFIFFGTMWSYVNLLESR